jgi:hypothetical protein
MLQMQKLDAIDVKIIQFNRVLASLPEFLRDSIYQRIANCQEERRQCARVIFQVDGVIRRFLATDTTASLEIRHFVESSLERARLIIES